VFPWPGTSQNGRFVDAYELLAAVRQRADDASLTIDDLDQAMRRLRAHRLNYPLLGVTRASSGACCDHLDPATDSPPTSSTTGLGDASFGVFLDGVEDIDEGAEPSRRIPASKRTTPWMGVDVRGGECACSNSHRNERRSRANKRI
jgi:hypothetical protein